MAVVFVASRGCCLYLLSRVGFGVEVTIAYQMGLLYVHRFGLLDAAFVEQSILPHPSLLSLPTELLQQIRCVRVCTVVGVAGGCGSSRPYA